ncbi:MAG: hypothetical protein ACLFPX_00020 [Candidatus Omnitrophota bacterium]
MRRWMLIVLCAVLAAGCTSTRLPNYVQAEKPFTKRVYADYESAVTAVKMTLDDLGWEIAEEAAPEVFEVETDVQDTEQILLITELRATRMFFATRYARINVYVRSSGEISEVELRYMVVNSMAFWKPRSYGSQSLADRFFELLGKNLEGVR